MAAVRAVFRVAAGPRIGFGHLIRCRSLARALGARPLVSVRGTARTRDIARSLGLEVIALESRTLASAGVLVVDDPSPAQSRAWLARARKTGTPTVCISDGRNAGRGACLTVDGAIDSAPCGDRLSRLAGPQFVVLDRRVLAARVARARRVPPATPRRVLIALGGGAQVFKAVRPLVAEIRRQCPGASIAVAAGFTQPSTRPRLADARWLDRRNGLALDLSRCDAAVIAGGVTLYEACAIGVPTVGLAVVPAQQRAIRAFASHGALLDAASGGIITREAARRAAAGVARLFADGPATAAVARELVDGRGVLRVAARIRALARRHHAGREAHA